MEVKSFRVENFRSIRDTGWQPLSVDNITVLVGQNESGKSSILDALELGYAINPDIDPDDFRYEGHLPAISLGCTLTPGDIESLTKELPEESRALVEAVLLECREKIIVVSRVVVDEKQYSTRVTFSDELMALIVPLLPAKKAIEVADENSDDDEGEEAAPPVDYEAILLEQLWRRIPEFILFKEQTCSLPNRIDIVNGALAKGPGTRGAKNFISASELDLSLAVSGDLRRREVALNKASSKITKALQEFWSQVLGRSDQISLLCELKHHSSAESSRAGQAYLVFWVKEGDQPLYPSQRSRGTKWFISFFLELLASNKEYPWRVFLLDEPASFLHPAAQKDVVRLLERLAEATKIVYSTHSPYMLDHQKLHRILAVERQRDAIDDSEAITEVRRGLALASASQLTLAPILDLIGVDLSQQQIIKRKRNVVLEEISAQYYIRAWSKLLELDDDFYLVCCGGVETVRTIVDLFIAWGIKFTVLVDGDNHGKRVVREIKAKYQFSDEEAKDTLQVIEDCEGIEDIFSSEDFQKFVLKSNQKIEGKNSNYVKKDKSKPLLALGFSEGVRKGEVKIEDLSGETVCRIKTMMSRLCESLANH